MRRRLLLFAVIAAAVGCSGGSSCDPHCIDAYHLETCQQFTDIHGNQTSVVDCAELMQSGVNLVCQAATASCELP